MSTKHILGLDLGTNSIGWALIETEENTPRQIVAMGSRIVPMSTEDSDEFTKGNAISKNASRTQKRTTRKGYDRYQLRRALLTQALRNHGMLPEQMNEFVIDLWKLRADAATEGHQLTLPQIGRVLYHINQKRGYKHSKADTSGDAKQTKYVEAVNQRYVNLKNSHQTIGQYFYEQLISSRVTAPSGGYYYTYRTKEQVFPRQAYIAEFDQIMATQRQYYPDILTDEFIDTLRNRIIFYQRPLKSCKHLISLCEFEMRPFKNKQGNIIYSGPKCAPRTSPLAQLCAIWETVNNIKLVNRHNEEYPFTSAEREALVNHLMTHEKMTVTDMQKILGISKKDGWYGGKAIGKGLKGNTTLYQLRQALGGKHSELLQMNLEMVDTDLFDSLTGEIIKRVSDKVEQEPLYRLWHVVYSISEREELRRTLQAQFGIDDDEIVGRLYHIDFVKPGYANKSHKFMRKILPNLMQGYLYSEACARVGINHSGSTTKEENAARPLLSHLPQLQKNELRQPIVEKILNQMINIVNALKNEYGEIDEIRVELARELRQSREERNEAYKAINKRERENSDYAKKVQELGIRPTSARVRKYRMWLESDHQCFYCGKQISAAEFLNGADAEVEHIIPRSVLFDDSFSNKVCACRTCNAAKTNKTAMEFMDTKSEAERETYIRRVDEFFQAHKISKTKRDHLLWRTADIPQDFIDRQLRQSQYIARKAVEILQQICRDVYATSGSVTDFLRHQWGYDEVLHSLNFEKYDKAGLTEMVTYFSEGGEKQKERIINWSKRIDHRHHAVDALTIALTRQSYIQRLNTLNASRDEMYQEVEEANVSYNTKKSLLEKWVAIQPHFAVNDVTKMVDGILVSFRAGKRSATPSKRAIYRGGKRIVVQDGLLTPRGALSKETVYGKLGDRFVVKYPLTHPSMKVDDIVDPTIQSIVRARLAAFNGNANEAFARPLYSDLAQTMEIKTVRCYTSIKESSVMAVRKNAKGESVGFSELGSNHHVAIYVDKDGKYHESVVSFAEAVMRQQNGIPVIIDNPTQIWDEMMTREIDQTILRNLPKDDWSFVTSMQVNEMFVLGLEDGDFERAIEEKDYALLNKHLYRVQKLTAGHYYFRHHIETVVDDKYNGQKNEQLSIDLKKMIRTSSVGGFISQFPHKVKINILGEISAL